MRDDGGVIELFPVPSRCSKFGLCRPDPLARAAWLLGDHHIAAELSERRLRVRRDSVIAPLLASLAVRLLKSKRPFEPEPGAYAHGIRIRSLRFAS